MSTAANIDESIVTIRDSAAIVAEAADIYKKPARKKPAPKHDFNDGRGRVFAHRHINGEGWVADTAKVADSVFVGKRASVYHRANIAGNITINERSRVCGAADIDANGYISREAFVAGTTNIRGTINLSGYARLYGGRFVGTNEISGYVRVQNRPTICDSFLREWCFVAGEATITKSTVCGNSMVGNHAYVSHSRIDRDVRVGGTTYIIGSTLQYRNRASYNVNAGPNCLLVTGQAKIVDANLSSLLHVKGHGIIVGGYMHFQPQVDVASGCSVRIECIDTLCVPNAEINTLPEFEMFNNPNVLQRAGSAAAVLANAPRPFNLENIVPRRRLTPTST